MLRIDALVYRIGGRILFDQASVQIPTGARVGLVGRNGTGKSTFLKLLAGDLHPDGGTIALPPRARIGYVRQEAAESTSSLLETVLAADAERAELLRRLDHSPSSEEVADLHERLAAIDSHTAPARAGQILAGLGFPSAEHHRSVQEYSGGWRMRVALAAVLFARPDILLLDEPSNHLDLEATLWLHTYLVRWSGTLVLVSHDRDLLNHVPNRILHLENGGLTAYSGAFETFERQRRERRTLQVKENAKQIEQRRKLEDFIRRFRAKASKARQAQSRIKMLERMDPITSVIEERSIVLDFPDPDPLPPPLLALDDIAVGYSEQTILRHLSCRIDMDDRIALLGANGNGKSTYAKLLVGHLTPQRGYIHRSGKLRIGYFAQHQADELDLQGTPLDHMSRAMTPPRGSSPPERQVRAWLGRFGFGVDHATTRVENLSGGEKARLLIALMCQAHPHMLILDEPTNHLDLDARDALIAALNAFGGAVLLITHDSYLIEACAERLWLVEGGTVQPFDGDMNDYKTWRLAQARGERSAKSPPLPEDPTLLEKTTTTTINRNDRQQAKRDAAQERTRLAPLKRAVQKAEDHIERLTARKTALETRLADPTLYTHGSENAAAIRADLTHVLKSLHDAEECWSQAMENLESASSPGAN